jgi:hypothetical protein
MLTANLSLYILWGLTKLKWRHLSRVQEQVGTHTRTVGDIQPGGKSVKAYLCVNTVTSVGAQNSLLTWKTSCRQVIYNTCEMSGDWFSVLILHVMGLLMLVVCSNSDSYLKRLGEAIYGTQPLVVNPWTAAIFHYMQKTYLCKINGINVTDIS